MDVKEAAKIAKGCILDLFENEQVENLGLEEAEFHESTGSWHVVMGFTRLWREPGNPPPAPEGGHPCQRRIYKSITIDDGTGKVTGVNRDHACK